MHAPSPFSASSSLSILRSAKLSRTPPVGLIRAVCLCEAAGALGAAGARHCQWTERLTLPGSCTQTHASRSPCYCFHLNPFLLVSLPTWVCACVSLISISCPHPPFPNTPCLPLPCLSLSVLHPSSLSASGPHKGTGGCGSWGKAVQQREGGQGEKKKVMWIN